jgi:hypothetical protein
MRAVRYLVAGLLLAAVLYGFLELMITRYESGHAHPPYSSFALTPQGTHALAGALARLPELDVEKSRTPLRMLKPDAEATLLVVGVSPQFVTRADLEPLEDFAAAGGRVVLAFSSRMKLESEDLRDSWVEDEEEEESGEEEGEGEVEAPTSLEEKMAALSEMPFTPEEKVWGLVLDTDESEPEIGKARRNIGVAPKTLPDELSWYAGLYLEPEAETWTVLYQRAGNAVLAERAWEEGSIVVASDSFFLSNEALRADPAPALLAHLVGDKARVIFDEAHLGLAKEPTVVDLIYRFRLEGFLIALVLAGLFYMWYSSVGPAPMRELDTTTLSRAAGRRPMRQGMVNLLERSVPRGELLRRCYDEWLHAQYMRGGWKARHGAQIDRLVSAVKGGGEKDIVKTYEAIRTTLKEKD